MSTPQENKTAPAAAQSEKPRMLAALPFRGKWALYLLAISLVLAYAAVIVPNVFYQVCDFGILPWKCDALDDNAGIVPQIKFSMFATAGVLSLWLAVSLAVFIYRWADGLPARGGLALLLLVVIGGGEMVIIDIWQGYAGSAADKITDYLYGVLIFWLAIAWHSQRIKEWLEDAIKKAVQAPVNAVKETVGGAVRTVKNTAEESVGKITKGFNDAAEAVKETADKSVDKITEGLDKTTEAVKGTADTIADSAKNFGQKISETGGEVINKTTKGLGDAKDFTTSAVKKGADIVKETASDFGEGVSNFAGDVKDRTKKVFSRDNKQPNQALPDKTQEGKGGDDDSKKSPSS